MAKHTAHTQQSPRKDAAAKSSQGKDSGGVDLSESSVYGDAATPSDDVATETDLDRLEAITGGAEEPELYEGSLAEEMDELDASTEEEVDALKVNLLQDDDPIAGQDGTGRVIDGVAEEQLARFTETGPLQPNLGAIPVEPGRDDTSARLRRNQPKTARSGHNVEEANLDEPRDEENSEPKADEGSAA